MIRGLGWARAILLAGFLIACRASEAEPSKGVYTVQFPSTAAAVATDFVQILVFDLSRPEDRGGFCEDLITLRMTDPASLQPLVAPAAANICEMRAGRNGQRATSARDDPRRGAAPDRVRDHDDR